MMRDAAAAKRARSELQAPHAQLIPQSIMGTAELERAVRERHRRFTPDGILRILADPASEPEAIERVLRDLMRWTAADRFALFIRAAMYTSSWCNPHYEDDRKSDDAARNCRNVLLFFGRASGKPLMAIIYTLFVNSMNVAQQDLVKTMAAWDDDGDDDIDEAELKRAKIVRSWRAWATDLPLELMKQSSESSPALAAMTIEAMCKSMKRYKKITAEAEENVDTPLLDPDVFAWAQIHTAGVTKWDMYTALDDAQHSTELQVQMNAFWNARVQRVIDAKREEAKRWQYSMNRLPDVLSHKVASYLDETLPVHEAVGSKRPRRVPMGALASFFNPHLPGDNVVDVVVTPVADADAGFEAWMEANPEYIAVPGEARKRVQLESADDLQRGYALVGASQVRIGLEDKAPSTSSAPKLRGRAGVDALCLSKLTLRPRARTPCLL